MRAHFRRMDSARRNVAAVARMKRLRLSIHRECHFAMKKNMRGFRRMSVVGIERVWAIFPNIDAGEAFAAELGVQFFLIHV